MLGSEACGGYDVGVDGVKYEYTVEFDTEAMLRAQRAAFWEFKWNWIKIGLKLWFWNGVLVWLCWGFFASEVQIDPIRALLVTLGICLLFAVSSIVDYFLKAGTRAGLRAQEGTVWDCSFDDLAWTFTKREGTTLTIPWSLMSIMFEHEDAWLVLYEETELWIFRGPIQKAGLEAEFRQRLVAP